MKRDLIFRDIKPRLLGRHTSRHMFPTRLKYTHGIISQVTGEHVRDLS